MKMFGLYYFFEFLLIRTGFPYGIDIPASARIGSSLHIGHLGEIISNRVAVIGRNCNLSQGITVCQINRGMKVGSPVNGDNVFIEPGAKSLGITMWGFRGHRRKLCGGK